MEHTAPQPTNYVDFCRFKNNISTTLITLVSSWTIGHNSRPKCWEISHNTVRLRGTAIDKTGEPTVLPRFYGKGSKTSFLKWPFNDIGLVCLKIRAAPLWLSEQRSRHGETCAFFAQLGKKTFLIPSKTMSAFTRLLLGSLPYVWPKYNVFAAM